MVKKLLPAMTVCLAGILILSCVMIGRTLTQSQREIDDFQDLASMTESVEGSVASGENEGLEEGPVLAGRDLTSIFEKNSDCIGWILIPETAVDYPVMHTPDSPQKYLRKNFNGEYSVSGVPFLEGYSELFGDNLVIYGHNMKNGTMFSDLTGYCDKAYAVEHPVLEFKTEDGIRCYTLYAAAQVKSLHWWYNFSWVEEEAEFDSAIRGLKEVALYHTEDDPQFGQQLITLSTCYGSKKDDRLIVVFAEIVEAEEE